MNKRTRYRFLVIIVSSRREHRANSLELEYDNIRFR